MTHTPPIRILCVDDHAVVREGVTLIIEMQPDLKVVGSAESGEAAVALFRRLRPDITLMDLQLPGMSGLDAIRQIRSLDPQARIVVLTMYEGDEDIYRALLAGATTYLLKSTVSKDLVRVVRGASRGQHRLGADVARLLEERTTGSVLTPRETEVLGLLAHGLRNKEIGFDLGVSEETIHTYVKSIFVKFKVQDRTAAVMVGLKRGIIHLR